MVSKKRYNKQIRRKSYKGGKANTPKYEPELTITPPINIQEIPDINDNIDDIDDDDYNDELNTGFYDDTDDDTDDDNERLDAEENAANIGIFDVKGGSKRKSKKRISKKRISKKRKSKKRKYKK